MPPKRFGLAFALAMSAYALSVLISSYYLPFLQSPVSRALVALTPVPAMLAMAWAVIRQIRSLDELHRRIQLEALGMAFVVTVLMTSSYGFLETAGLPRLSMFMVWPLMGALWAAGTVFGARRYR
ncbi:hypothetical protein SJI00_07615 [Pseudomonas sp. RP23018S]|uniref:hypothetical protein n=1 Tax=Pseudomonas sp. RP23018S TaxID=3096037 RepID=UPI002ACA32F5|nr:hypothetical protein [Pseudomonas sp. RP23018S]MDZ5602636.1 hypothetical protein [Pseudomonas sp. RP23018S]